ncbi:MAG: hypothetical protein QOH63_1995 [Acidobacteriota bacterium]|jgi:hypothetical protein|nr:hypothetical protein [Acidobacteriota bacterium]
MDIVAKDSGGINIVAREEAIPRYYPPATTHPVSVDLHWRKVGQKPGEALHVGSFAPGATVKLPYNPLTDGDLIFSTRSWSANNVPDVSSLEDAYTRPLTVNPNIVSVGGIDEHVPTVTLAPTIAKASATDAWIVLTPAPDAYGATITDGQLRIEKADDASIFEVQPISDSPTHQIDQKPYASKISYRWRNQSTEDAGGGRGWSAWSPQSSAAEIGASVPPPPVSTAISTFTYDAHDSRAAIEREVSQ